MMNVDRELKKAIQEMRTGSKAGFVAFFNKTFQFTCLWAAKTMSDTIRRDDFLSDFYPYALLHIADLTDDEMAYFWLEKLLPIFYELWSGQAYEDVVRPVHPDLPDESAIKASASIVWTQINRKVTFPKPPKKAQLPFGLVIAAFVSVAAILICILIYQNNRIQTTQDHSKIDAINENNRIFSTNTELDDYLQDTYEIETEHVTVTEEYIIHEPTESDEPAAE